jgi:hypothetical protein
MRRAVTGASVILLVVSILGFVGSMLVRGFSGDYAKYGSVAVPGTGKVTLPKGEVDMFFVAYTPNSGNGGPVTIPDLKFSMDYPASYADPVVKEDDGGVTSINTKEHVRIWKVTVKTAGTYTVTTDGDVAAFIDPQLSFGTGSSFPGWLPIAFGILFVVSLCGTVVGQRLVDDAHKVDTKDQWARGSTPASASTPPYDGAGLDPELQQLMDLEAADRSKAAAVATAAATPSAAPIAAPSTDTPEQSMARLQQLEQLQQLHAGGTLSDAEYDAARKRLGST